MIFSLGGQDEMRIFRRGIGQYAQQQFSVIAHVDDQHFCMAQGQARGRQRGQQIVQCVQITSVAFRKTKGFGKNIVRLCTGCLLYTSRCV